MVRKSTKYRDGIMGKHTMSKKTLVIMAAGLGSRYGGVKQVERMGPGGEILMEYAIFKS